MNLIYLYIKFIKGNCQYLKEYIFFCFFLKYVISRICTILIIDFIS